MEFPKHEKSPNIDRISNLPSQILELILSYLPVRDIVRTSVLSTDWRHKWVTVPNLVFGKGGCSSISESEALASIIDRVLLLHTGSVEVFKINGICIIPEINRWVFHICQRSIKALVLEFHSPLSYQPLHQYELPSCLCHCESLVELKLSDCLVTLPTNFEGFKSLKSLCLEEVTVAEDALQKLICSCPLLEELTFIDFEQGYDNLIIDARYLRYLDIRGGFRNITFRPSMDRLVFFSFERLPYLRDNLETSLTEILTKLPSIQQCVLLKGSLYYLSSCLTPNSVPIQCKDLHYLSIVIDFSCEYECLAALYLFRCSYNLSELEIEVSLNLPEGRGLCEDISKCNLEFRKLRYVKVEYFDISNMGVALKFIRFLLASSPALEKMTLSTYEDVNWEDVKQINGFKRASAEAKIIFERQCI